MRYTKQQLEYLNNQGYSYEEIAEEIGFKETHSVGDVFKRLGINKKKSKIKSYNSFVRRSRRKEKRAYVEEN